MRKAKGFVCILLAALMLLCVGCEKQCTEDLQELVVADFDHIVTGMLLSEAVEMLGCRGKYVGGWYEAYEYETRENIRVRLECERVDASVPKYDQNLVIIAIKKFNPDGSVYWEAEQLPPKAVTAEQFAMIQKGMYIWNVVELLGYPGEQIGSTVVIWEYALQDGRMAWISFSLEMATGYYQVEAFDMYRPVG